MVKKGTNGFSFIELLILSIIICILFAMLQHPHRSPYTEDENECLNNQRLLSSAIEIYKIDYPSEIIGNVYPGLDYENFEKKLLESEYCLKEQFG